MKAKKKQSFSETFKKEWMFHVMLLPAMILLLVFAYFPMVGIVIAFQDFVPSGGIGQFFHSKWIGFDNFKYIFGLQAFRQVLVNTLVIAIWKIITLIIAPLCLALMLNEVRNKVFKKTVQTVIYVPYFLSWVILGGILIDLLSPTNGILNKIIVALGGQPIYFLGDNKYIRGVMVVSNIWKEVGYNTVIYLAALMGIDQSLYEASSIDGAGRIKQLFHITIPGIMPITKAIQLERAISLSGSFIPQRFKALVDRFGGDDMAMAQAGIAYATDQIIDLYANGVKNVHLYTMNKPEIARAIQNNLSSILGK